MNGFFPNGPAVPLRELACLKHLSYLGFTSVLLLSSCPVITEIRNGFKKMKEGSP